MRVVTIDLPELGEPMPPGPRRQLRRSSWTRRETWRRSSGRPSRRRSTWWRWRTPTSTTTTSPGPSALARRHGADYLLSADEPVDFERVGVRDGDLLGIGSLDVRVIATPGHTRHHQSFLAAPRDPADGHPGALFSGGSLLHGTVGRTDLLGAPLTRDLARAQWASARSLGALDAEVRLHPTHGFGSFCASSTVEHGRRRGHHRSAARRPTPRSWSTGTGSSTS